MRTRSTALGRNTHGRMHTAALLPLAPNSALQASESSSWQRAAPGGPTHLLTTDTQIPTHLNLGSPPTSHPSPLLLLPWMDVYCGNV